MDQAENNNNFVLDSLQVTPSHNQITSGETTLALQPKVMAVLLYLAKNQHRVISNEELIEQVWQGRVVTHGSVQKSINSLRSAFAELAPGQEYVVHYSKRGYQLVVPVQFTQQEQLPLENKRINSAAGTSWGRAISVVAIVVGLTATVWMFSTLNQHDPNNSHLAALDNAADKTHFPSVFKQRVDITSQTGHERSAEPHPDGKQIAYIRDIKSSSTITIRDAQGNDWQLAASEGRWQSLAWSRSGRNLAAIEIRRAEGTVIGQNYYEPANFLYTFHIFTLDFKGKRLLEKNLLSQWQGVVNSVTWWDENTLEIVASQGLNGTLERYRYIVPEQRLELLSALTSSYEPVRSSVYNGISAVVSKKQHAHQLEILSSNQTSLAVWPLKTSEVDISWLPDGSGVLVFDASQQQISALSLSGKIASLQLPDLMSGSVDNVRYRKNGQSLMATLINGGTAIELIDTSAQKLKRAANFANGWPVFSPEGTTLAFASLRNSQHQLRLLDDTDADHLLATQPQAISHIRWPAAGNFLLYQSGNVIWQYAFDTGLQTALLEANSNVEPLWFDGVHKQLWYVKSVDGARNIWLYGMKDGTQKQMSFGAVATALEEAGNIYFQYSRQPGLWQLRASDNTLKQVSAHFPAGSLLLRASADGVYFVSGGPCRESPVRYLEFTNDTLTTLLDRENSAVKSYDFDPNKGALQTSCSLLDSNIVEFQP